MMLIEPGLYLSPIISQWPNPTSDVTSPVLWWTPDSLNVTPCYDGVGGFEIVAPGQLLLDIRQARANKVRNVALIRTPDGNRVLAMSPEWPTITDDTAAAFRADTAFGTWLPVNTSPMTMVNGGDSYDVPAGQALLVGTICPGADGVGTYHVTCGPGARRYDAWNRWRQKTRELILSDPCENGTVNHEWTYSSRHPGFANGNPYDMVCPLTGRPERVELEYHQTVGSTCGTLVCTGIQWDSESWPDGQLPQTWPGRTEAGAYKYRGTLGCTGRNIADPSIAKATIADCFGAHSARALHWVESYADQYPYDRPSDPNWSATFYGNEHSMRLTARYLG